MPTKKTELDDCPVESCDAAVSHALVTTDGTKLTTNNMTQARTCLYPTELDGDPASYIVFHDDLEEGHAEPDVPVESTTDDDDEREEQDDEGGDSRDIEELGDDPKTVFRQIMETEPIDESSLAGKCVKEGLSPTHVKGIADALYKGGHIEKEDGKYVTA